MGGVLDDQYHHRALRQRQNSQKHRLGDMAMSEGVREPRAKEGRASDAGTVQCVAPYGSGKPGSSRHNTNGISHLCNCKETVLGLMRHENIRKRKSFRGTLSHPAQLQPS